MLLYLVGSVDWESGCMFDGVVWCGVVLVFIY